MYKTDTYTCQKFEHKYGWASVTFTIDSSHGPSPWELVISTVDVSIFKQGKRYRITAEELPEEE